MTPGRAFTRLVKVVRRLRGPDGCPWDREQTLFSLARFVIEECYEVVEAIEKGSAEDLREELGDVQLMVVLLAELAREQGAFDMSEVLEETVGKLRRRHPHVFGRAKAGSPDEVVELWEGLKAEEKETDLRAVPRSLPALARAQAVQGVASRVGFDWPDASGPRGKVAAELEELGEAVEQQDVGRIEEEAGDVLFSVVNLCRMLGVDAETALRGTVGKFEERMKQMERTAAKAGKTLPSLTLAEMDALWEESKGKEPAARQSGETSFGG